MLMSYRAITQYGRRSHRTGPTQTVSVPANAIAEAFDKFLSETFGERAVPAPTPLLWVQGGAPDPYAPTMPASTPGTITAPLTMEAGSLGFFEVWAAD